MKYLEFNVNDMVITRAPGDKTPLVSGCVNFFGIHFNFDEGFAEAAGIKSVEFYKNREKKRVDLVDGACLIPNFILADKSPFEIRVVSGNMVATSWLTVQIVESGTIQPEIPDEDLPETMDYVKSPVGDGTVAMFRKGKSGLEFSQNGEDWESGINGIPDVPESPKNATYVRKNGDWVIQEEPEAVEGLKGTAVNITELAADADLTAVIAKVNEIVTVLADRGITVV
ncbi:hypothetical protein D7V86_25645 [bacterium D16-51]|nr:hypothetical protein D7V96_26090 [bacterium D16-59]RKI52863.1 hypothetical protein D7V86_25645 [bacterium D16-51]